MTKEAILKLLLAHTQNSRTFHCSCGWRAEVPGNALGSPYLQHKFHLANELFMAQQAEMFPDADTIIGEAWRVIPGHDNWEASNTCKIRNKWTQRIVGHIHGGPEEPIVIPIESNEGHEVILLLVDIMNRTWPEN